MTNPQLDMERLETRQSSSLFAGWVIRPVFVFWVAATIPLVAFIMGPSVPNPLVVDDYWWLWRLGPQGNSPLSLLPAAGHYSPTIQLVLVLWYRLFGLDGTPYHLLSIALYWLGAMAVALLGWRLTNNLWIGIATGTGVLINHQPAQAYVWALGIWYTISTVFFVIGFVGYLTSINALEDGKQAGKGYWVYLGCLTLGILTHEQGLTLAGITLVHTILLVDRIGEMSLAEIYPIPKLIQRLRFFGLPLGLTMGAIAARYIIFEQAAAQILPEFPAYEAWLSIVRSFLPGVSRSLAVRLTIGAASHIGLDTTGQLLLFLFQLTILLIAFWRVNRWYKFLLLWTAAQVIILLYGLGFLFPRHYYLATVPSILLWTSAAFDLLTWIKGRLTRITVPAQQFIRSALIGLVALILVVTQFPEHRAFQESWRIASETSKRTFQTLENLAVDNPACDKLVLLNLPDTLISSNREWIGVFNAGTVEAVGLYLPGRFKSIRLLRTPLDQHPTADSGLPLDLTQPHLPNLYFGVGQDIGFEDVGALLQNSTILVVQFDTATMDIFQVRGKKGQTRE